MQPDLEPSFNDANDNKDFNVKNIITNNAVNESVDVDDFIRDSLVSFKVYMNCSYLNIKGYFAACSTVLNKSLYFLVNEFTKN